MWDFELSDSEDEKTVIVETSPVKPLEQDSSCNSEDEKRVASTLKSCGQKSTRKRKLEIASCREDKNGSKTDIACKRKLPKKTSHLSKLLKTGVDGWLCDRIVFDYLGTVLPDCFIVNPMVWVANFNLDKHGILANRSDLHEELVFMPICTDANHWVLVAFDATEGYVIYFDTLGEDIIPAYQTKAMKIADTLLKQHKPINERPKLKFKNANRRVYQKQEDGDSCGPLICMIAKGIFEGKNSLKFSQDEVRKWRRETYDLMMNADPPKLP
ncbi:hypothetical protein L596_013811 [Steinernema carpocapsae]|uniref:Ubiquitin-like protease family profile domain-containing protein n=1 Tax=Steinernema carpocapsae TaxID=34508 RepID=A0A4U5P1B3_STECR|nr:hypothetical protein L596_013811 [Steinernema carpocapsae]